VSELSSARGQARLAFTAGGESLNPLLHATPADQVSTERLRRFTGEAERIAAAGAAAFGEIALEHFSSGRAQHPYESSPPDHPLLLALADLAARYGMPIEIHMEAVPQDMAFPAVRLKSANPDRLNANILRFERLLAHNPSARFVWAHAGWDLAGMRTPALMQALLSRHANLSMNIKADVSGAPATAPLSANGGLQPAWLAVLRAFPERFKSAAISSPATACSGWS
jgi:predicted TIM-barrel fold metal-dependent hydrolase